MEVFIVEVIENKDFEVINLFGILRYILFLFLVNVER